MKRININLISILVLIFSLTIMMQAQIPQIISYQGVLTDSSGTPRPDGIYTFTFRLYGDSSGGSALWMEIKDIQIKRGLFSTRLGDQTSFAPTINFNRAYWLSIKVGAEAEMLKRIPINAVAYSLNSVKSDTATYAKTVPIQAYTDSARIARTLPDASLTGTKIANDQVVKSLNHLNDNVVLSAQGGATITTRHDTIIINAGTGGGGTGIQGIQNTNSTLDILNPNGPTATVNLKSPLSLSDTVNNTVMPSITIHRGVITGSNAGSGSGILGKSTVNGTGVTGLATGTGKAGYFKIDNDVSTADALVGQTNGVGEAIYGYQLGTGRAGYFAISNAANTNIALHAQTNGTGSGIYSVNSGTGMAGHFYTSNASNDHAALRAETNGTGPGFHSYVTGTGMAGHFQIDNTSNSSYALRTETNGLGTLSYFGINNSLNIYPTIYAETNGKGEALSLKKTGTGSSDALEVINTATNGRAGIFRVDNAANPADALYAWTFGTGDAVVGIQNGSGSAVRGTCGTSTGQAGWFEISNTSNGNIALLGKTNGLGRAGWFEINNSGNVNSALVGITNGTGNAVIGRNDGMGHAGEFQITNSINPQPVISATHSGMGDAVRGSSVNRGVVGIATTSPSGVGVLGESQLGLDYTNNYGVFSNGRFGATGPKLAVVPIGVSDPKNPELAKNAPEWRGMYCVEATEIWFEDFGYGKLNNGSTTIQFDEIFTQTVNTKLPYHIFITPYGESKQLYVTNKTENSFTVNESSSGNSSIEFSYRIVAKRLGYDGTRLEKLNSPVSLSAEAGVK